ncbi:hypothetical protein DSO57_1003973 [Entomophthora muscae]|uniref:Uncharacterized protein n=1 Tax=Entomophthora muscae TaxID=34485 RepID=A0ACC2TW12_9FUNG|nr:hypothetical protein DSO57_1003973 [Entomophthora muscae]
MKKISAASPLPNAPPAQDFSKLGVVYITVLGLADQVVPHTGSWHPLATAVNYLVRITPVVYMAFQAQPDSSMGCDSGVPGHQSTKCELGHSQGLSWRSHHLLVESIG